MKSFQFCMLAIVFCLTSTPDAFKSRLAAQSAFYDPLQTSIEGWQVSYDPRLDEPEHKPVAEKAFQTLANHLQRVEWIVPEDRLTQLKTCRIWLDLQHSRLTNMQYHPSRRWLIENDCDPRMEKHVHIPVASQLYARHVWAQHPYVVLHELAHAYHDQFLDFENSEIKDVFAAAREAKIYESVLNHQGHRVKHYGLNNAKEYFAEMTEAYFGVNDFFPFVRAELKSHDPRMFQLLQKIWGRID